MKCVKGYGTFMCKSYKAGGGSHLKTALLTYWQVHVLHKYLGQQTSKPLLPCYSFPHLTYSLSSFCTTFNPEIRRGRGPASVAFFFVIL